MRLGINGWRIHGQRTGVGRYLLNVVRHWTQDLVSAFSQVTFYTPKPLDRAKIPVPENIAVELLASELPMLVWENARLAVSGDYDVLFCPSYSRPLYSRGKTVVTTHDAVQKRHPELFPRSVGLFYNRLYGWSARNAALVITDSEAGRQDIAECWRVPAERIRVVHLAPLECFHPCRDESQLEACHQRAVGSSAPFFLFVGKISGRRNLPCLLEAFSLFKKRTTHPQRLLLAGLNPHHLDLGALCGRLGIGEHVRFCGYVSDEDLNLLYNRAEALVMPSVYETVSLPVMEAQAAGAPVVCIETAGMREITGGAAAMIHKLEAEALLEAMIRVIEDRTFRRDIAARGLENSQRFSWLRCSKETLAVLTEAAASG